MNTFKIYLAVFAALFISSCSDDDNHHKDYSIVGTWQLTSSDVDAELNANATMTEQAMETFLADYTFFAKASQVIFTADSVTLTAELGGTALPPFKLAYTLSNDTILIASPIPSILLKGHVDVERTRLELDLTPQSYMSILKFIGYTFPELEPTFSQIATAEVDYHLTKME